MPVLPSYDEWQEQSLKQLFDRLSQVEEKLNNQINTKPFCFGLHHTTGCNSHLCSHKEECKPAEKPECFGVKDICDTTDCSFANACGEELKIRAWKPLCHKAPFVLAGPTCLICEFNKGCQNVT